MNKKDFLYELENAFEGRLSESDVREIVSDYGDIFDNGTASGKSEEEISKEIGSPARIARTILEDGPETARPAGISSAAGERQYTDFQKNINEKTSKIFDKVIEPDKNIRIENLAPMPRRLGAYIIDGILLGAVTIGVMIALSAPFLFMVRTSASEVQNVSSSLGPMGGEVVNTGFVPAFGMGFGVINIILLALLLGAFNLFTTIFIWATNGYTPGKWMLKMRVVKIDGSKISFLDALLRELVIKCLANSVASGFLNIGSFIWGCVTEDHKTVHDLVAKTRVVEWDKTSNHA
jgi:uncharacterized RDD family membrane protein YckC